MTVHIESAINPSVAQDLARLSWVARGGWERLVESCTRPEWRTANYSEHAVFSDESLDALIVDGMDALTPDALATRVRALVPLGRLLLRGSAGHAERVIRDCTVPLSITTRVSLGGGIRAVVAERHGDAGKPHRRRGAHPGAYKMSRYKAYHQMQAAIAMLTDCSPERVIEIGDSNGVLRDMLGHSPCDYFRAHYPPHDLQTLHLIPDASCDVFICDNTLEHVADPLAAVRQMGRVIRPGGWLVLFAPFIAMCQDDDRCRWSVRALSEMLAPRFDSAMLGGWGNVDAACWYMRANKWLRVLGERAGSLTCRDSRDDAARTVEVSAACDRLHPIHVWAVARRSTEGTVLPACDRLPSAYAGFEPDLKAAIADIVAMVGTSARFGVYPGDDGSAQDRFVELGATALGIHDSTLLATSALNRGFETIDADASDVRRVESSLDALLVRTDAIAAHAPDWLPGMVKPGGLLAAVGKAPMPEWAGFKPVHGSTPTVRVFQRHG